MSNEPIRYIKMGKLGAVFGVKGWLKVHSYAETILDILNYSPWYLSQDHGKWSSIEVEQGRMHGNGVIVKFKGINTPEEARLFTGKTIAVSRTQLATLESDEYYWADLEGLNVINSDKTELGKVTHLLATGSNDVLVVNDGSREVLIPYLPGNTILKVSLADQTIYVDYTIE